MTSLATAPDTTSISSGAETATGSGAGAAETGASHADANLLAFCTSASHGLCIVENHEAAVDFCASETNACVSVDAWVATSWVASGSVTTGASLFSSLASTTGSGADTGTSVTKLCSSTEEACCISGSARPTSVSRSDTGASAIAGCSASATAVLFGEPASIAAAQASPEKGAAGTFRKSEIGEEATGASSVSSAAPESCFSRVGVQASRVFTLA